MGSRGKQQWGAAAILLLRRKRKFAQGPYSPRNRWVSPGPPQPLRQILLLIPCRCSKREAAAEPALMSLHRRSEICAAS